MLLKLITSDTKILVIFEGNSIIKPCDYPKYKGLKVVKLRLFKGDDTLRVYIGNISAWGFYYNTKRISMWSIKGN